MSMGPIPPSSTAANAPRFRCSCRRSRMVPAAVPHGHGVVNSGCALQGRKMRIALPHVIHFGALILALGCAEAPIGEAKQAVGLEWFHDAELTSPLAVPTTRMGELVDIEGHVAGVSELYRVHVYFLDSQFQWKWQAPFEIGDYNRGLAVGDDAASGEIVAFGTTNAIGVDVSTHVGGGVWETETVLAEEVTTLGNGLVPQVQHLDIDGRWLGASAQYFDSYMGRVFMFLRIDGHYYQTAEIFPPSTGTGFGGLLALDGGTMAVRHSGGRVHVYSETLGVWNLDQTISTGGTVEALAVHGSRIAVRHKFEVRMYEHDGTSYMHTASVPVSSVTGNASSAYTLAMSDQDLAIGHPTDAPEEGAPNSGYVAIHDLDIGYIGAPWHITSPNSTATYFGETVSLFEHYLVVGAPNAHPPPIPAPQASRGEAHIFERTFPYEL